MQRSGGYKHGFCLDWFGVVEYAGRWVQTRTSEASMAAELGVGES
jgi:hypothetical protein